eukprot:GEMP01086826.1.p1 GENE.GEMP01086826.1~~GEMP01086826.1.p1  ORF type:complete len:113 (+),score=22.94 GEMP01086826.1:69-407(+)
MSGAIAIGNISAREAPEMEMVPAQPPTPLAGGLRRRRKIMQNMNLMGLAILEDECDEPDIGKDGIPARGPGVPTSLRDAVPRQLAQPVLKTQTFCICMTKATPMWVHRCVYV